MSATTSPESSSESESALDRLEREAEEDGENDLHDLVTHHHDSGAKLRAWRKAEATDLSTPRSQMAWEDMDAMFPSIPRGSNDDDDEEMRDAHPLPAAPTKPKPNRWTTHQLRQTEAKHSSGRESFPVSDMGLFSLLPGELRNLIYRLAFVPPPQNQPVVIAGSDLICGRGACVHHRAPIAAPGMASTCLQIRNEVLPIYVAENEFRFDAAMVRNRCVAAWARCLDSYAGMVRKVTLEVLVLRRDVLGVGTESEMGEVGVECPAARGDGRFEVVFSAGIPRGKIEGSKVLELVERVNGEDVGEGGRARRLASIVGSDELAEMIFRSHGRRFKPYAEAFLG
ncbi:hypothetical protein LTR02_005600 [Friedmanniomyces endolithicus]|nr:hypothetical protein LTR94_007547 [Friedmanniomyces endolithicus]KAK0813417.1 hypothetical protein LTR59_001203 [Friedmanniomyces endolithicus]KAK0844331.1 hypothetical protein LTS02_015735 [Friedmanniomyces endolithicus]KAK0851535.1 hypothetical protein LTR03_004047 [Friedmanniomyces endolithicus]KAK0886146.1 hypothetical protein LTR87_000211 [Friedmanniomyces endolithicus]